MDTVEDEKSSTLNKIKTSVVLVTVLLLAKDKDGTQSWPDTILQAAAKRREIIINPNRPPLQQRLSSMDTHPPKNYCDIHLGIHNLSRAGYQYTLKDLRLKPAPAGPLLTFDLWERLDGFPTWEGMYEMYYGRGSWDNVWVLHHGVDYG